MSVRDEKGKFVKGFCGNDNPKGKPRGAVSVTKRLKSMLELCYDDLNDPESPFPPKIAEMIKDMYGNATLSEAVAIKMLTNAILKKDSEKGIKELLDRVEGKVVQKFGVESDASDIEESEMVNITPENALISYQRMIKDVNVKIVNSEKESKNESENGKADK